MAVTLTVAWALFALAPGLAVFAGLFLSKSKDVVHPAAPAPASLIALAIVVFGALTLHALSAAVLTCIDGLGAITGWTVSYDPNVYRYFLGSRTADELGIETAILLTLLLALSGIGFFAARQIGRTAQPGSTLHALLYGWLSPILTQLRAEEGYLKHLIAWVVTDLQVGDLAIGYEGQVETISLTSDKQIAWLTLRNCETFVVAPRDGSARRQAVARETPIPRMQVEGPHIVNLAYAVALVPETIARPPLSVENPSA
ncbi:hypothetical protein [uncultured Brevundimonas sp.]|uniref:hypothetical protein n=1 Tax=uncultured Brevundimonas sp. TaxID=213418 RepID=UPI002617E921|nr:hypothetical protein [uncultured Brevundimonas sp.]